jgi:hypothetical protein
MPWLRLLVTGLLWWSRGFDPRSVHVSFVCHKMAVGRFCPSTSVFPCQYHSTNAPYSSSSAYCPYQTQTGPSLGIYHKRSSFRSLEPLDGKLPPLFSVKFCNFPWKCTERCRLGVSVIFFKCRSHFTHLFNHLKPSGNFTYHQV